MGLSFLSRRLTGRILLKEALRLVKPREGSAKVIPLYVTQIPLENIRAVVYPEVEAVGVLLVQKYYIVSVVGSIDAAIQVLMENR